MIDARGSTHTLPPFLQRIGAQFAKPTESDRAAKMRAEAHKMLMKAGAIDAKVERDAETANAIVLMENRLARYEDSMRDLHAEATASSPSRLRSPSTTGC